MDILWVFRCHSTATWANTSNFLFATSSFNLCNSSFKVLFYACKNLFCWYKFLTCLCSGKDILTILLLFYKSSSHECKWSAILVFICLFSSLNYTIRVCSSFSWFLSLFNLKSLYSNGESTSITCTGSWWIGVLDLVSL
jgi:hypothetical protein